MLRNNVVHGDLSPFNILYHGGRVWMIDFPQAVDPRSNRNAYGLLTRDLEHVCQFFAKFGVQSDPYRWGRAAMADYTPPAGRPTTPAPPDVSHPNLDGVN